MAISYAGQELLLPVDHDWNNACKWVEDHIRPDQIYEAYFNLGEEKPWKWYSWPPRVRPGELVWPNDASRWAYGHFFAGRAEVDAILMATGGTQGRANLVMSGIVATGGATDDSITAQMFMLPPCPILQFTGKEPCYLITLVDQRFFWWQYSTVLTPMPEGITTWADVITSIWNSVSGSGLISNGNSLKDTAGSSYTTSSYSANYLKPARSMESIRLPIPPVFDQAAYSIGQRVVCDLDGTVNVLRPTACRTRHDANATKWAASGKLTGGLYQWNAGVPDSGQNTTTLGFLPSKVSVCFPTMQDDWPVDAETEYLVDISASTNPAEVRSVTGNGAYYPIHSTCPAWFLGTTTPAFNDAELTALSNQIASDFYRFQLGYLDAQDSGIISLTPDGLNDRIEWLYNYKYLSTHIVRGTYTPPKHWLYHASAKFSNSLGYFSLKRLRNANMYYPGKEQWKITERPKDDTTTFTGSAVNNYKIDQTTYSTPTSNIDWIRIIPTAAGSTLTGIQDGFDGKTIKLTLATHELTLKHNTGSSTGNKILTPDGNDYRVSPGKTVMLKYAGTVGTGNWLVIAFDRWPFLQTAQDDSVSGSVNNYVLASDGVSWLRWATSSSPQLSGIANGIEGRMLEITNYGSADLTILHFSSSSSTGNKIVTPTHADLVVSAGNSVWLKYDNRGGQKVWFVLSDNVQGVPDEKYATLSMSGDVNNYALPNDNTSYLVATPASNYLKLTGMTNGRTGRMVEITNGSNANFLNIPQLDSGSSGANRFNNPIEGDDILIGPGSTERFKYFNGVWQLLQGQSDNLFVDIHRNTNQVIAVGAGPTQIALNVSGFNQGFDILTTANSITFRTTGTYLLNFSADWQWTGGAGNTLQGDTYIQINGVLYAFLSYQAVNAAATVNNSLVSVARSLIVQFVKGDILDYWFNDTSIPATGQTIKSAILQAYKL